MAYTYKVLDQNDYSFISPMMSGIITTDASTLATMTISPTANQFNNIVVSDNTNFVQNDLIQVNGAGTSGTNMVSIITVIGNSSTATSSTLVCVRQYRPFLTAVTTVSTTAYYKVWTRFEPQRITLLNLVTLVKYEWFREMNENTCYVTTSGGTLSLSSDTGIFPGAFGFAFHPSLLGVSSTMSFKVDFANA